MQCREAEVRLQEKQFGRKKADHMKAAFGECLYSIRFGAMKPEEFISLPVSHKELFTSEELNEIFFATITKEHKSEKFNHVPRSSLEWDKEKELVFSRYESELHPKKYSIQNVESVRFSSCLES